MSLQNLARPRQYQLIQYITNTYGATLKIWICTFDMSSIRGKGIRYNEIEVRRCWQADGTKEQQTKQRETRTAHRATHTEQTHPAPQGPLNSRIILLDDLIERAPGRAGVLHSRLVCSRHGGNDLALSLHELQRETPRRVPRDVAVCKPSAGIIQLEGYGEVLLYHLSASALDGYGKDPSWSMEMSRAKDSNSPSDQRNPADE